MVGGSWFGLFALVAVGAVTVSYGQVTQSGCGNSKADILFILDSSGSVGSSPYATEKSFVNDIVKKFTIGPNDVQIGVIHFSSAASIDFYLNTHSTLSAVTSAVTAIPYTQGGTQTAKAIKLATDTMFQTSRGDRPDAPNIAIVITDGDSGDLSGVTKEANRLKATGVTVFGIGVGNANDKEMQAIATSPSSQYYFKIGGFGGLQTIIDSFAKAACVAATLPPTTPPPPTTPKSCSSVADIVFVIDGSGSIDSADYTKQISFLLTLVDQFDISATKVQIAAVSFSSKAAVEFGLDAYFTKASLKSAIQNITQDGGSTYTNLALQTTRQQVFTGTGADRYYAPNIVVILTDGDSTNKAMTKIEATALRNGGATVFSIGIGSGTSLKELIEMASKPDSQYVFEVTDFNALDGIKASLAQGVCNIADPTPVVQQGCVTNKADVVFVVDSSLSVGKSNFNLTKQFLLHLVDAFDLSQTRVGLTQFNNKTTTVFNLKDYSKPADVKAAIKAMTYDTGSDTRTSLAMLQLRNEAFSVANGNRPTVPDVAIIVTDGRSKEPYRTHYVANKTKNEDGVIIFSVGIGAADQVELANIASDPDSDFVYYVKDFASLSSIEAKLIGQICKGYKAPVIKTTTPPICKDQITCFYEGYEGCRDYTQWARDKCPSFCGLCPAGSIVVVSPPLPCVDKLPNCASFNLGSICFDPSYRAWMRENCRSSCSACTQKPLPTTTTTTTTLAPGILTTSTTPLPTTSNTCHDSIPNCAGFPEETCTNYPDWAKTNCIRKCLMCPDQQGQVFTQPPCDNQVDCDFYGKDVCTDHPDWAAKNCRSFCSVGGCTPAPVVCKNILGDAACAGYDASSVCVEPDYRKWAEKNCNKFCGLC